MQTKYHQIIQSLFIHSLIEPETNLPEINLKLYEACKSGDFAFVSMFSKKKINFEGILYSLNEDDRTAVIFQCLEARGDIFIPRSIECEGKEYVIDSIFENAFKNKKRVKSIQFSSDSELKRIEKHAFYNAAIKKIRIPSSVTFIGQQPFFSCELCQFEFQANSRLTFFNKYFFHDSSIKTVVIPKSVTQLKKGWCARTLLENVDVEPGNPRFKKHEKFIVGKSDEKSDVYDVLYFAPRNIKNVNIPSFIRVIAPYAFDECESIKN